jgi:hypothetical protein
VADTDDTGRARCFEDALEQGLSLFYRAAAQIVAVEIQQIECEIGEPIAVAARELVL